jgi:hypothetical protein
MAVPIRRAMFSAGLILATGLTGCSSSGGDGSAESTSSAGGICSRVSPGEGVHTGPAPEKAVTKAYELFFSTATSFAKSMAVLQHGVEFCPSLAAVNHTTFGKQKTSATVESIRLTNPKLASVKFTIKVAGQVVLPHAKGYAVLENGDWKVAAETFCQLLTLEGHPPDDCDDESFTALPK